MSATNAFQANLVCIERREPTVQAWAHLDIQQCLAQAKAIDAQRTSSTRRGRLWGRSVGVKDIIDVAGMPTGNGTHLPPRVPSKDASLVGLLRKAGVLIAGKTVTTEFALGAPRATRNPHDLLRTPGASSSGSAAAVAAGMSPLAIGTQTNGSVIRPAAYCGIVGYKPTAGLIARDGILDVSKSLDQVGVFATNLADASALATACAGRGLENVPMPVSSRLGVGRSARWSSAEPETQRMFDSLAARVGHVAELSPAFDGAWEVHRTIMEAEAAQSLGTRFDLADPGFSDQLKAVIERGRAVSRDRLAEALGRRAALREAFARHVEPFDAILTLAVTGEAPLAEASTGSPVFCTLWSLLGVPAIALPLFKGANGLPIGVQLVGAFGGDEKLLSAAAWLCRRLGRYDLLSENTAGA